MAGDNHGAETPQEPQTTQEHRSVQSQEERSQVSGVDWKAAIAERDEKIASLEQQVAEASKNAETAEALRSEIAELKAQEEDQRVEFELRLAGVRNVKAAKAILSDHGGDVAALKGAEPWLFANTSDKPQGGKTGLPNAGTSSDDGKTMRRWRKLAGLDDADND